MPLLLFANNAETTLATGIAGSGGPVAITIEVTGDDTDHGTFAGFGALSLDSQNTLLVTLTHEDNLGQYEVLQVTGITGTDFDVLRGVEGEVLAWPAGTLISARLTAGALAQVAQTSPETGVMVPGSFTDTFQFGAWPTMQLLRQQGLAPTDYEPVVTPESWQGSIPVDLGTPVTWSATNFYRGSVVRPTTPDGSQYWLDIADPFDTQSLDSVEPTWGTTAPSAKGTWHETVMPVDISSGELRNVLITEVGFICHKYSASSPPSVSIGTAAAPTRFVNNQSLSQMASPGGRVHRFPLATGDAMVTGEALKFKVDTAASGGRCLGRFYWRGIFIQTNTSL